MLKTFSAYYSQHTLCAKHNFKRRALRQKARTIRLNITPKTTTTTV